MTARSSKNAIITSREMETSREKYHADWEISISELGENHPETKAARKAYFDYMQGRQEEKKLMLEWLEEHIDEYLTVRPYSTNVDIDMESLEDDYHQATKHQ